MNKKISTLFTAGLLVAGSLCGSAWADEIDLPIGANPIEGDELSSGQEVFMALNNYLYGFDSSEKTNGENVSDFLSSTVGTKIEEADLNDFIWTVSVAEGASEYTYTLTNKATGDVLRVKNSTTTPGIELDANAKSEDAISKFVFRDATDATKSIKYGNGAEGNVSSGLLTAIINESDYVLSWDGSDVTVEPKASSTSTGNVLFYEVEKPEFTKAEELNALYNGSGFSFEVNPSDAEGNLFDGKIVAIYLNHSRLVNGETIEGIQVDNSENPSYTSQEIPNGWYFFTANAPLKADGQINYDYNAWLNATVIAVSSTETVEATVADRKNGQGFGLTTMKIKDMNLYTDDGEDWESQGDEVSILNACFTMYKTYGGGYPYALTLEKFRYRESASDAKHTEKLVSLVVIGHSDSNYLATKQDALFTSDDNKFIFKLQASGMIDGIDLLNKEAKAAVYSIRVLDGMGSNNKAIDKEDVKSAYGKYMTVGETNGNFRFVAKAKVLAMENTPAYQWVITEVKNNDVTFTNRETDESFTAKLFPVEGQENVYELAVSRVNDDDAAAEAVEVAATNVTPIYVDQNTYNEAAGSVSAKLDKLVIELKPVEVDPYAGFLNVENKTLVTMAFARDNNETSNKWYAAINEDGEFCADKHNAVVWGADKDIFVTEASDAAQWQLIKSKSAKKIIERSFVYNDNGHVTVKAKADVAYAYQYKLQYIADGEETYKLFWQDGAGYRANDYVNAHEGLVTVATEDDLENFSNANPRFIIKQNADGSIYLIQSNDLAVDSDKPTIFAADIKSAVYVTAQQDNDDNYYGSYSAPASVYGIQKVNNLENDMKLHTYLIEESPEVSYPAEEGYVYMQSEMGDYISMNADRDGIVVDENPFNLYLHVTDTDAVVPSFYISKGIEGSAERAYLFHPQDSVDYYAATGNYDREYMWNDTDVKAIFKVGTINATRDTIATMIKGEMKNVAVKADDEGTFGGLKNFKVQIVLADDSEDQYVVRSLSGNTEKYLYAVNEKLTWTYDKDAAMKFTITEGDPTANEAIANEVEGVKVIAGNGTVEIQGAAGKNVVIANILGKVVASTTLTSDNQTINVPAGIVVVTVDGEAVKAVVR